MTDAQNDEPREPSPPATQLPARTPVSADERGILAIIPRDTEEASRYASALIRSGMVPDSYRYDGKAAIKANNQGFPDVREGDINAPLVLAGILKALEIGLPPQTGLGAIYPIRGIFTVYGDGATALVQRDRVITKQVKRRIGPSLDPDLPPGDWPPDYGWLVQYWRRGQETPYEHEFRVRDAVRPGLWMNAKRAPWVFYPDRMLFNRARAFVLRDGFADCLYGLGIREEIEDMLNVDEEGEAGGTRHRAAFDDEPETDAAPALEHREEVETDLGGAGSSREAFEAARADAPEAAAGDEEGKNV